MRRRKIYLTPEELNRSGANTAHPFQREAVAHMLQFDWSVAGVQRDGRGNSLVVMRHNRDSKVGAAVYPDGGFVRSPTATVKWNWKRVADAALATIPAQFLVQVRAGNEAKKVAA